jgi:hypothetical protein
MKLKIKPIVNNLYHATISHGELESTAVGATKGGATKKALEWFKREIETYYQLEEADNSDLDLDDNCVADDLEDILTDEEKMLSSGEFLNDETWNGLEDEVHELARHVAKIALKAALKFAIKASIGGSCGGLFTAW